jgi:hypothetical protein
MVMRPTVFDFAKGLYPRESRIAAAKRNAVGGKRKRCTKGKNCSAACIAANMICLVDLPWVGSALTKAKAQIQAAKKNAPAPAAAPAATPAPAPAATAPKKTALDKIPTVETYKKWGVAMLEEGIQNLQNSPKFNPNSAAGKKAVGNMTEALKQLKAEAGQAAAAKAPPAPAPQPAAKPKPAVKVETVDKYKSFGLPFLEKALPLAEGGPAAQTTDGKKAIANIKQAISELKAQAPKVAPGAATVTPAAKPAATSAAKAPPATAPAKESMYAKWDTDKLVKFQNDFISNDPVKYKGAIEQIQQELDARGYKKPSPKPTPLVKSAEGNKPQPNSPSNPQGLSINQQIVWKKAFEPITADWYDNYKHTAGSFVSPGTLLKQGKGEEARIVRLLKGAQDNKYTQGLAKIFDRVKVNDKYSHLSEDQLQKLPSSVQSLVKQFGQNKLKRMLLAVEDFTGNDYTKIRNAYRGRPPVKGDDKVLSADKLKKEIAKYKRKGELIQEFLTAANNRPAVPKFRGVPATADLLDNLKNLAKTGGTFQEAAMNSWSTNNDTAKTFTSPKGMANNRVMFRTLNKLGSSVKALSSHGHEDEILTPGGARYKVVGYTPADVNTYGNNTVKIHFFDVVEY